MRRKGYRLGVATVDTLTATVAGLRKTGILEYFDYLGTGEESRPKPDTFLADRFCSQCGVRRACPVGAFDELAYDATALGQSQLPGTDGTYDRITCNTKMAQDVEDAAGALAASEDVRKGLASTMNAFDEVVMALPTAGGEPQYGVTYCRMCEPSCPVGRQATNR